MENIAGATVEHPEEGTAGQYFSLVWTDEMWDRGPRNKCLYITYGQPPSNSANQPCNSNMSGNNFSGQGCSALLVNAPSADENEVYVLF